MESILHDHYADQKETLPLAVAIQSVLFRGVRNSVLDMLQRYGAKSVLDVCSGAGTLAAMIKKRGMDVQAVDGSKTMAEFSRSHYGIIPKLTHAEEMDYHEQFDAAVVGMSLHEMTDTQREVAWAHIEQAVKNNGMIIAVDYNVPNNSMLGRGFANLMELDEASFDTVKRYAAYQRFIRDGGIVPWVKQHKNSLREVKTHMFGNIAVVAVMK